MKKRTIKLEVTIHSNKGEAYLTDISQKMENTIGVVIEHYWDKIKEDRGTKIESILTIE